MKREKNSTLKRPFYGAKRPPELYIKYAKKINIGLTLFDNVKRHVQMFLFRWASLALIFSLTNNIVLSSSLRIC